MGRDGSSSIDDVEADADHELVRSLPLAPGLYATLTATGEVELLREGATVARLAQLTMPDAHMDGVEIVFGRRVPEMGGFCFPTPDTIEPRCDIRLCGAAGHPRAFALSMQDTRPGEPPAMSWNASGDRVDVEILGTHRITAGGSDWQGLARTRKHRLKLGVRFLARMRLSNERRAPQSTSSRRDRRRRSVLRPRCPPKARLPLPPPRRASRGPSGSGTGRGLRGGRV